ncbi:uncharacterized protein LOC141640649 [Silene latifolia]|uniref:uncharacterized protein LOC141640649 n=1 Tax=Silene latifolia TaxID=37657 RepID=UPI003D77E80F
MRFNPHKCAFGVTYGKLLGHIVSHRGIVVDPSNITAIMEMPNPETEKQIQDPIKYLFEKPVLNGQMSRWTLMLSEFDLKYVPLNAIKGRAVADFLDDNPIEEAEVVAPWPFPDEDMAHIEDDVLDLYFDGASNYMGYRVGILLVSPKGEHMPVSIKLDFNVTNNAAEYEACLLGLRNAIDLGVKKLLVHGDLSLVINQVVGSSKIKSSSLTPYPARIYELERYFDDVKYVHLPRDENQFADALSKLAALINITEHMDSMPICVEKRSSPSYVNARYQRKWN